MSASTWKPARSLYQTRHTFVTTMLDLGEAPAWIAKQLGHTTAEMIPTLQPLHPEPNEEGRIGGEQVAGEGGL